MFLAEQKIDYPCDVNYQNCAGYLRWRETPDPAKGKYKARKNTAILEFKFFRWLMSEAVRRGYCTGNPAREVVLKREPRRLFPDLSDKTLQEIYAAILTVEDPNIRNCHLYSFAISLLQGVRLNETNINPVADVKLLGEIPTIRFWQKGSKGFKRERFKPLHPQLIPLFQRLQAANQTTTYSLKQGDHRWKWGNRWTKFFIRHNFKDQDPNICFHSIRITVENVLRESSIEQRVREYYLTHEHGHGDVNAAYDRVKIREMVACHACLTRPWLEL
jgi:integrase